MKDVHLRRLVAFCLMAYHLLWVVPLSLKIFHVIDWSAAAIFAALWVPAAAFLLLMIVFDSSRHVRAAVSAIAGWLYSHAFAPKRGAR